MKSRAKPKPKAKGKTRKRKLPKLPPTICLGTYKLGVWEVALYAAFESQNGSFTIAPAAGCLPEIVVGCDWDWHNAVGVYMHEALEFVLAVELHRFRQADPWGQNHAEYIFSFDHQAFTRATDMLGHFTALTLVKLSDAYATRNRELKRRRLPELGKDREGHAK